LSHTVLITGTTLSQRQRVELLAHVTGDPIALTDLTPDAARQLMGRYLPAPAVDLILGVLAEAPQVAPIRPAPPDLVGRDPYDYLDWATHHAHRFTGSRSVAGED
jgi:hypothetical protein